MMLHLLIPLLLAWLGSIPCSHAGEIIGFQAGPKAGSQIALAHVSRKALVAEFLDPENTGLGKSISYLMWREILTAISDQAGAGVILARAPGEERITDMLEKAYHNAAIDLAKTQKAGMAIWGAVSPAGDDLYISTYLSLLPESADANLTLRLFGEPSLPSGLQADISRTNFNFPPLETTRAQLFDRRIVTRSSVKLHAKAEPGSQVVANIPPNTALDSIDMDKGWFKVRFGNGKVGYLDNSVVDVPPITVEATRVSATLKTAPAGKSLRTVRLDGTYRVIDMRYLQKNGLWYELAVENSRGWIPAHLVRARFSFPIVHFVAGLYRYQFNRYEDARREFSQYVSSPNASADNPSLATAYQLLGASTLLTKSTIFQTDPSVGEYFTKAVEATPYDATAYSLRALYTLAVQRETQGALQDLKEALTLDPTDKTPPRMIETLRTELKRPSGNMLKYLLSDSTNPAILLELDKLSARYPLVETRQSN